MPQSKEDDVSSIVQSFVQDELSTLDKAADSKLDFSLDKFQPPRSSVLTGPAPARNKSKSLWSTDTRTASSGSNYSSRVASSGSSISAPSPPTGQVRLPNSNSDASLSGKRTSLGDKFKGFGRRIASGNSKK